MAWGPSWTAWLYRQHYVANRSFIYDDFQNFTVPFIIDNGFNQVFSKAKSDGSDIAFTASDGETQLKHDLAHYNATPGSEFLIAWIKIPSLLMNGNLTIYMYYGNNAASPQEDKPNAWDDYFISVWPLHADSGHYEDSKSDNDSTIENVTQGVADSMWGKVAEWTTATDEISIPSVGELNPTSVSFEVWIYPDNDNDYQRIFGKWAPGDHSYLLGSQFGALRLFINTVNGEIDTTDTEGLIVGGQWQKVGITFDETSGRIRGYYNADIEHTATKVGALVSGSTPVKFGKHPAGTGDTFDGKMALGKLSRVERSEEWWKTSFAIESNNSLFWIAVDKEIISLNSIVTPTVKKDSPIDTVVDMDSPIHQLVECSSPIDTVVELDSKINGTD